jgi:hypothetical protein
MALFGIIVRSAVQSQWYHHMRVPTPVRDAVIPFHVLRVSCWDHCEFCSLEPLVSPHEGTRSIERTIIHFRMFRISHWYHVVLCRTKPMITP